MIKVKKKAPSYNHPWVEEPVSREEEGPIGGTITTHPAYGQIRASRVSGNTNLYDSEFKHQHYITVAISRSEHRRNLSNNWLFGREELIEVAMSEAQWVSFISTMNIGSGTACTIERVQGERMPSLPNPAQDTKKFKQEMLKDFKEAEQNHKKMVAMIEDLPISTKKKEEMLRQATMAYDRIQGSLGFVADQFGEHMENTTNKAKAEVEGFFTGVLVRLGIKSLKDKERPFLMVEEDKPVLTEKTGTNCAECGEPQYECPSGVTCINGHGGAEEIDSPSST